LLSASLGISHLSTGELLRTLIREGDDEARVILSGAFVSDEAANRMVLPRIEGLAGFILDGYPRTLFQARSLSLAVTLDAVILLELDEVSLEARASARRICGACGASLVQTGHCEECGGEPVLRPEEDTPAKRAKRLELYQERTAPLIDYYAQAGLLRRVDATGSPEKIACLARKSLPLP
jgi:adenylate kinase